MTEEWTSVGTLPAMSAAVVVVGVVVVADLTSDERVVEVGVASSVVPLHASTTNTHTITAANRLIP